MAAAVRPLPLGLGVAAVVRPLPRLALAVPTSSLATWARRGVEFPAEQLAMVPVASPVTALNDGLLGVKDQGSVQVYEEAARDLQAATEAHKAGSSTGGIPWPP